MVDYSKRQLSKENDRAVALSGLAFRIAEALHCQERYGIFDLYLHRSLLWRRSDASMTHINYKPNEMPSWSWMAYTGGIEFIEDKYGSLDLFRDVRFMGEDGKVLITDLWGFIDCQLKQEVELETTSHKILTSHSEEVGWARYDVEDGQDLRLEESAVIGRSADSKAGLRNYHIIILRQKGDNEYLRVGYGMVHEGHVLRQKKNIHIL